ncbi:hypothetical protein TNIN_242001 [Trichonephila inaurata madagascariensis]|uniref:Secreted protein n=1 Tax=Trichonephila inaurata madagascariensis TaxID=2747483 RepID=A0A8X6JSC2_9ARAC|nr:hypothetical protein TNIN_242001 [Trichonephila inaurata madagascariensis]
MSLRTATLLLCCVSGVEAVLSIVFENGSIRKKNFRIVSVVLKVVVMTSMSVEASEQVAEAIFYSGGRYLEAPLVGSNVMQTRHIISSWCRR